MINLYAPVALEESVKKIALELQKNLSNPAISKRLFLIAHDGPQSLVSFLKYRDQSRPFYKLGEISLIKNFADPLEKHTSYLLYLVSDEVKEGDLKHNQIFCPDPDEFIDTDNPEDFEIVGN